MTVVGLAPGVVAHEVDVGAFADFGLHMAKAKRQRVDPHLPLEGELAAAAGHKREVEAWTVPVVEGVENVVPVVDVAAVVQGTREGLVQQQHLVLVQVDLEEFGLHARSVLPVLHPGGACGFDALLTASLFGAHRAGDFGHKQLECHPAFRRIKVVPNPGKGPPKSPFRELLGVVVEGDFLHLIEIVVQGRNARRVVGVLGLGHPLHQGLGGVDGLLVRPDHRGLEVHAARLERHVDDLRHVALQGDGLALVAQTRVVGAGDALSSRFKRIHALCIGHGADAGPGKADVHKGKRHPGGAVKHAAGNGGLGVSRHGEGQGEEREDPKHQRARRLS